jgi:hypothetical protein
MKKIYYIVTCYFLAFNTSYASTYTINFPELNGTYAYPSNTYTSSATAAFDLGVQFSSISSIELVVTASGNQGTYQSCYLGSDCSYSNFGQILLYGFSYESGFISNPNGSIDLTSSPSSYTETLDTSFGSSPASYDFLLDGAGSFFVQINAPVFIALAGLEVNFLSPTTLNIYDIAINIEGTTVPLPPALWLFGFGGISLFSIARTKRNKA